MTTLAVYSNKGGVGKTAAAVNLAYLAAQAGKTTLICDLDSQGATTFYLRIKPKVKRQARGLAKASNRWGLPASRWRHLPTSPLVPQRIGTCGPKSRRLY